MHLPNLYEIMGLKLCQKVHCRGGVRMPTWARPLSATPGLFTNLYFGVGSPHDQPSWSAPPPPRGRSGRRGWGVGALVGGSALLWAVNSLAHFYVTHLLFSLDALCHAFSLIGAHLIDLLCKASPHWKPMIFSNVVS